MAEGHVVGKWGGVLTHAARSSENRKSGQEQIPAGRGRKPRKSALSGVRHFSLTWGVNGYLSLNQALVNQIITPGNEVGSRHGDIQCRERLGGMLRYYYRVAA